MTKKVWGVKRGVTYEWSWNPHPAELFFGFLLTIRAKKPSFQVGEG